MGRRRRAGRRGGGHRLRGRGDGAAPRRPRHAPGGGDDADAVRAVCGEVWIDGTSDYVRFVQVFAREGGGAVPLDYPMVAGWNEAAARVAALRDRFCRDAPPPQLPPLVSAAIGEP